MAVAAAAAKATSGMGAAARAGTTGRAAAAKATITAGAAAAAATVGAAAVAEVAAAAAETIAGAAAATAGTAATAARFTMRRKAATIHLAAAEDSKAATILLAAGSSKINARMAAGAAVGPQHHDSRTTFRYSSAARQRQRRLAALPATAAALPATAAALPATAAPYGGAPGCGGAPGSNIPLQLGGGTPNPALGYGGGRSEHVAQLWWPSLRRGGTGAVRNTSSRLGAPAFGGEQVSAAPFGVPAQGASPFGVPAAASGALGHDVGVASGSAAFAAPPATLGLPSSVAAQPGGVAPTANPASQSSELKSIQKEVRSGFEDSASVLASWPFSCFGINPTLESSRTQFLTGTDFSFEEARFERYTELQQTGGAAPPPVTPRLPNGARTRASSGPRSCNRTPPANI